MPRNTVRHAGPISGDIYFEHISFGNVVKVSAIHSGTGTEVSITGPASAGQKALERTALQKLVYVMSKK
ncbi:MAG TPA: serine hydroxymethyltransferase [Afifellaceae bacterium]|nr:serine hydroxymethyltransferase [Afifellaceae bacterium]